VQPSGRDLAGGGEAGEGVDDVVGVDAEAVPGGAGEVELVGDVTKVDQASGVAADVAGEQLVHALTIRSGHGGVEQDRRVDVERLDAWQGAAFGVNEEPQRQVRDPLLGWPQSKRELTACERRAVDAHGPAPDSTLEPARRSAHAGGRQGTGRVRQLDDRSGFGLWIRSHRNVR